MRGIRRFFRRQVQVAGLALAGAGLLLHVAGVIGGSLWWVIAVLLYGAGVSIGLWEERMHDEHQAQVTQDGLDADAIKTALAQQFKSINGRVPAPVMDRFLRIRSTLLELLPRARELPPGSMELYLLQQTALDYLPNALHTYLQLPPAYARSSPVDAARTPVQVLLDELTLIDRKMEQVRLEVRKQDTDRFLAHGRFLEDRFADQRPGMSLPPAPGESTPPPATPPTG